MEAFRNQLLANRRISVWGIGYLGYTLALKLQNRGFMIDVHDFNAARLEELRTGNYLAKRHRESWSTRGEIPALDLSKLNVCAKPAEMFRNSVHFVSFPGKIAGGDENRLTALAEHFLANQKHLDNALIIFQSAETPGDIQRYFIEHLGNSVPRCSFATAFRTDWSVEELSFANRGQVIAGHDPLSLEKISYFYEILGIDYMPLGSIKETEIYESARKSLQYVVSSFSNQLALAYADTDIRKLVKVLLKDIRLRNIQPSIGALGYKNAAAAKQLLDGSKRPDRLTLIRDAELDTFSSILTYAEIIKRHAFNCVTILGLSERGDQKDIRLSPSVILGEKLLAEGTHVKLHDPFFTSEEIRHILPGAEYQDIDTESECECLVLMTPHRSYRYLTQDDVTRLSVSSRMVIDNACLWANFSFSIDTIYHVPGDGNLEKVEQ